MKHANFLMLVLLCAIQVDAQRQLGKLNQYFNHVAQQGYMNGNILLAQNGQTIYQRSFGMADIATGRPNNDSSRFNLASISKVFTSTAVLQLKEKGLLQLNDTFQHYFPSFPYGNITIRQLLTHTSGLPDLELYESLIRAYPDTIVTNDIIIPTLIKEKTALYFSPGDQFRYSNTNYSLLALLVERLSGQSFAAYLRQHIFEPAGMRLTSCDASSFRPADRAIVTPQVYGMLYDSVYTAVFNVKRFMYTAYNNDAAIGASNIVSTSGDLQLFDKAFFEGRLISAASMKEAFTPVVLNNGDTLWEHMDTMRGAGKGSYGLGWGIFRQPGFGTAVGHGGFKFGLATFYYRNIDLGQTIIAFDNAPGPPFGDVVTSAFCIMNQQPAFPTHVRQSLVRLFAQAITQYGFDNAVSCLNTLKSDTSHYYFSEKEMNQLGYEFLYFSSFPAHQQLAVQTFMINMLLYPDSFNTYDSYAEALSATGKKQEAILMYQKSIALNPNNEDGIEALQRLLSQH
ncbi:serine hydrolase domain-containing protein [Chitinophaga pinensis]|uniref:Beta-lactamase n=1 Tax=Chitinophaga pinensis (strain ATCC 43595 / DSM 2588 / LMG 13176 / NBRC 15968 / NCIMB 11800 / UQM 2034) TaxID=485918 RepID=A0A979G3T9_CHIPD|nr:serine hydrolase domain-containing protein [Chitinophaga pinensis]ACU60272.1 beta-lactamase [Chitinophaga pinensis DSM 2588]